MSYKKIENRHVPNGMCGGVRGRKTKVGRKLLRFPPTRLCPTHLLKSCLQKSESCFTEQGLATFKRDFKKVSRLSPQKWLIRKRLEAVHDKIRNDGKKVSDACFEAGFKNLSHFSRIFKKQFGYAPTKNDIRE